MDAKDNLKLFDYEVSPFGIYRPDSYKSLE